MISYRLETNLNQKALHKMEETIPPLISLLTDVALEATSVDELISLISENCPFSHSTWLNTTFVPTYNVWIYLSSACKMVVDFSGVIISLNREIKLKKLLE
jgi:hypothetical protein